MPRKSVMLRVCTGDSSSSKTTTSALSAYTAFFSSSNLPSPIYVAVSRSGLFCIISPTTSPPAVFTSSPSSATDSSVVSFKTSRKPLCTPARITRSCFCSLYSIMTSLYMFSITKNCL